MEDEARAALIAYDGSEDSGTAIVHSAHLLGRRPAVVVHVWQSLAGGLLHTNVEELTTTMREAADELDEERRTAAERIAERGAQIARDAGFGAEARAIRGPSRAWATLLDTADDLDAAVVVAGSRGAGAVDSALFGSVSSGLLHHARRPVLVVPAGAKPPGHGPVLIGYDGSESAAAAVAAAAELLAVRQAVIQTVWVPYGPVAAGGVVAAPVAVTASALERLEEAAAERAESTAEAGARAAGEAGLQARAEPARATGPTWSALRDAAEANDSAAIVVGSRGRGAVAAAVLGSTSAALVHHARMPVLVVPSRAD